MLRNIIVVFVFIFSSFTFADGPDWISDITKGCKKKSELCAVGSGVSLKKAEADARVALAKIFENKISSSFSSKLSSTGGAAIEDMNEEILESTQLALEGIQIKKTYEDKLNFYALAVVDKKKAAAGFRREINKLDDKISVYAEDSSGASMIKMEKEFVKRESLAKSYEFLTGGSIPPKVSFEKLFKTKKAIMKDIVVHVYLDEGDPKGVEAILVKNLSDLGYKVTSGQTRNKHSTNIVTGELIATKKYMKVEGFEKYELVLKLVAKNAAQVETGHLNFSVTDVGRNYAQVYDKAIIKIKEYLNENLAKLNIE